MVKEASLFYFSCVADVLLRNCAQPHTGCWTVDSEQENSTIETGVGRSDAIYTVAAGDFTKNSVHLDKWNWWITQIVRREGVAFSKENFTSK